MNKIAFYIMNSKGLYVLNQFVKKFGSTYIDYIVSSKDKNIRNDSYKNIQKIANKENIRFFDRFDNFESIENNFSGYKFAIGWRWIIKNERKLIIFHDSLLPRYRGFAPLVNTLINNESRGGNILICK